jgi:hypothetical protein
MAKGPLREAPRLDCVNTAVMDHPRGFVTRSERVAEGKRMRTTSNQVSQSVTGRAESEARAQAGNISETRLWSEYATSMPKGLPGLNDQGLDRKHTWARTYWGGALYCHLHQLSHR